MRLRGVQFYWKDPENVGVPPGRQMGFIAQEVEKVFPEWVTENANGYKVIAIDGFEALVIEALRELNESIDGVEARLDKLEAPRAATSKKKTTKT